MTLRASAPGSIMVTGEHAVVYGGPAIVCAIEQRVSVTLSARADSLVEIRSAIADPVLTAWSDLRAEGPMRFVAACLLRFRDRLDGISVAIHSEIDPTLGLGSSAAVTVAMLGGLAALTGQRSAHADALEIVRAVQGRGSGADLAASRSGGAVAYQLNTGGADAAIEALPELPPLSLRYAGYKTPTATVLAKVADAWQGRGAELDTLYTRMGDQAHAAITALRAGDLSGLATALDTYQKRMVTLGVSDPVLDAMVREAADTPGVLAAKISGSGLGDCVLAVGRTPTGFTPVSAAKEGLVIYE
ncbi:MAG: mevalonate kinase [Pseudomonadota bacterium]